MHGFLPLYLINKERRHDDVRKSGCIDPPLALDGGQLSVSLTGRFTSGETAPVTHWIGGWVGPTAGLDAMEKEKYLTPAGNRTTAVQPVARRYIDSAIPAVMT
jgi:hypothetical protein